MIWENEKYIFAILSIAISVIVAMRPIPSVTEPNDTGRYLMHYNKVCQVGIRALSAESPFEKIYYGILVPLCPIMGQRGFMFLSALLPLIALLLFISWRPGTFIYALALPLSVPYFELATNALRQGASIFFLLGAMRFAFDRRICIAFGFYLSSCLIHVSNLIYLPIIIWLAYRNNYVSGYGIFILLFIALTGVYLLKIDLQIIQIYTSSLRRIYSSEHSGFFDLFVAAPFVTIYLAQRALGKAAALRRNPQDDLFIYHILIATLVVLLAPYIFYRFAMVFFITQLFVAVEGPRGRFMGGATALMNQIAILWIYIAFSDFAQGVIGG